MLTKIDIRALPIEMCATKDVIANEAIGIGDSVFLTGLFTALTGERRNIPIVRVGNIAAMPEEPVNLAGFGDAEAYLVEVRSIGGLSECPVFVHLGLLRVSPAGHPIFAPDDQGLRTTSGPFYLFRLMHSHWSSRTFQDMSAEEKDWIGKSINLGIAIVVPATKILEVINQPLLLEIQKKLLEENLPTPDSI
jgi:hypothetical protein